MYRVLEEFYDQRSERWMALVTLENEEQWLCYRHPDGQWVTLRMATDDDIARIEAAKVERDRRVSMLWSQFPRMEARGF